MDKHEYRCYCNSIQLICQVHRHDPIANKINPEAVKAYWDRRDGVYNERNEEYDRVMGKSLIYIIRRHKMLKVKKMFFNLFKCFISWDFSKLRLKDYFNSNGVRNKVTTWTNRWAWVRLFGGLIEFKFHLHNCAGSGPWYRGIVIRFRVSICGVFKPHLVLCIGPEANSY